MQRINVECYSGRRAHERPRRITIGGREHVVARLLNESVEQSPEGREQTRHYKVLTEDGITLEVLCASEGEWYLKSEPEKTNEFVTT